MLKVCFQLLLTFVVFFTAMDSHAQPSANYSAGLVVIGQSTSLCDSAQTGAMRWNSSTKMHDYCDGTSWKAIATGSDVGVLSAPVSGTGYFVLSNGTWNGNLGGRAGADTKCLDDLTNNDWLNKSDANTRGLLVSAKVKAFICTDSGPSSCNHPAASTTYTFAVSGSPYIGGATFTTDASQRGPSNSETWAATNYFGHDVEYWANRATFSGTQWDAGSNSSAAANCAGFTGGGGGQVGSTNFSGSGRWHRYQTSCSNLRYLICMVNP